jgi:hypothetical protein
MPPSRIHSAWVLAAVSCGAILSVVGFRFIRAWPIPGKQRLTRSGISCVRAALAVRPGRAECKNKSQLHLTTDFC